MLEKEHGEVYTRWIDDYNKSDPCKTHLIKIHQFNKLLVGRSTAVFTSRRDLRDVAASLVQRKWVENSYNAIMSSMDRFVSYHKLYEPVSTYEMCYEQMKVDHATEVLRIAKHIGVDWMFSRQAALEIATQVQNIEPTPKGTGYNKTTLLHFWHQVNGRVGYYKEVLSPNIISAIEKGFEPWMKKFGYLT
jgi:hypothetical protein